MRNASLGRLSAVGVVMAASALTFLLNGCDTRTMTTAFIEGVSMSPTLWGEHRSMDCLQCGFPYRCDPESVRATGTSVCPNCGFTENPAEAHRVEPAQRYLVVKDFGDLRRWDVVAFQYPPGEKRAGQRGVKRVVGLPGETIWIQRGTIWAGEYPVTMEREHVRETMIPVYDSRFQPPLSEGLPARFVRREPGAGWHAAANCWYYQPPPSAADAKLSFMDYVHWRCCRHLGRRTQPFPIEDYHPGDQSLPHAPNPVSQILVEVELEMDSQAVFQLSIRRPVGTWTATVDGRIGQIGTTYDGLIASNAPVDMGTLQNGVLEISTIGGVFEAAWNGKRVGRSWEDVSLVSETQVNAEGNEAQGSSTSSWSNEASITIGAGYGSVLVKRVRIFRGIHYVDELAADGSPRKYVLGPDEYFVVGDHVTNSIDSRHWAHPGLPRRYIVGIVKPIVGP